jgi:hypothetical protein
LSVYEERFARGVAGNESGELLVEVNGNLKILRRIKVKLSL